MKLLNNLFYYPEQGMLDSNTYIIKGNSGIIVDPGNTQFLMGKVGEMRRDGISPEDISIIVNTHLHIDHRTANESFKKLSGAKIALHPVQKQNYHLVVIEADRLLGVDPVEFKEDYLLDEKVLNVGDLKIDLIPCPGHSPDCVCYYLKKEKVLICGDVLFDMNTGRVDLPGGNAPALKKSIESLAKLDVEYLLPGHMGIVAGADKVAENFKYIKFNVFPWL
jgi:hydroxyacylglutathione hydrolase